MTARPHRAGVLTWMLFLFLLPFWEGSASPEGLLAAHLLFLAAVAASVGALGPDRWMLGAAGAVLGAAALSGLMGPYRFASWLALIDLTVLLGVLVLGEALIRRCAGAQRWFLRTLVAAGLVQSALILASRLLGSGRFAPGTFQNPSHAGAYLLIAFWALVAEIASARDSSRSVVRDEHAPDETLGGVVKDAIRTGPAHSGNREGSEAGASRPGSADDSRGIRRKTPWAVVGIGALLLAGCLVQASRGVLMALLGGAVVYVSMMFRGWSRRIRSRVALAALLLLFLAGTPLAYRFATKEDPYQWDRLRIWGVALKVALQNPIFGCGPGVFPHVTARFDVPHFEGPVRYSKHVEATHSDPMRIVAETGLIGTLAVVAMLAVVGQRVLRGLREGGSREAALGAALCGLLVQCAFENLSSRPAVSYSGAMIAAMLLARGVRRQQFFDEGSLVPPVPRDEPRSPEGRLATDGNASSDDLRSPGTQTVGGLPLSGFRKLTVASLLYGGILAIALLFVVAPYLGHRSFRLFKKGVPPIGERYQSALWWSPFQPDYRAALAEAVLAAKDPGPEDLKAGFLAIDDAISLKPIDGGYFLSKARLGRRALLAASRDVSWTVLADASYRRAESLDPSRPQPRLERGWMLLELNRPTESRQEADLALASEPNSFEARRLRAASLFDLGDLEQARAEMEEARDRHEALASYVPADAYETQVLRWDDEGWSQIARKLEERGLR